LKIYPNPARDVLYIESGNEILFDEFSICNYLGQEMSRGVKPKEQIKISTLEPGIYMLFLRSNHEVIYMKFIKK